MSNKTMSIPTKNQFSLSKVKLVSDGGLIVHYEVTEVVSDQAYSNKFHVESAKDVHPDMKKLFDNLRPVLGRVFHLISFQSLLATPGFKATKAQKELGDSYTSKVLDNIEARGVSFSGQDDNIAVIITGLMTVGNGQKTAINTPRIKFNSETYGFEEELENIVDEIESEVYEFLFNGKKAQLELFGANNEPAIDDEKEDEHTLFDEDVNEENDGISDDDVFLALESEDEDQAIDEDSEVDPLEDSDIIIDEDEE